MNNKVKEFDAWMDDIYKIADYLEQTTIEYGYLNSKSHPNNRGANLATVAYHTENGTKNSDGRWRNYPRKFMTQAEMLTDSKTDSYMSDLIDSVGKGSIRAVQSDMKKIGKDMADNIREAIMRGKFRALKPSTVAKKGHSVLLVETGTLYKEADSRLVKINKGES